MRNLLLVKNLKIFSTPVKFMCSSSKLCLVEVNDKSGVATLTLNRPPVNGLNVELLACLKESLCSLENNKSRGIILTSVTISNVFLKF